MATITEQSETGIAPEDATMGKVMVQVEMSSYDDEAAVEEGRLKPEQVRRSKVDALVDTGATLMVLPEEAPAIGAGASGLSECAVGGSVLRRSRKCALRSQYVILNLRSVGSIPTVALIE